MLYRKHRPQSFEEVVGQDIIVRILKNFLKQRDRLPQGYLFAGQRGTGKTTTARIFAKVLNCLADGDEPCGSCRNCEALGTNQFMDLIEIDAASNRGIDEIRNLKEHIGFRPIQGKYKVFILDEAHQLTEPAWNALLKTLEEPPPGVIFILATTEPEKIPTTILSRVQRFDFRRIGNREIIEKLKRVAAIEGAQVDEAALTLIADEAQGSMRDAETLFEKLALSSLPAEASAKAGEQGTVTEALVEEFLGKVSHHHVLSFLGLVLGTGPEPGRRGKLEESLNAVHKIYEEGFDLHIFNRSVIKSLRELLLLKIHPAWKTQLERDYTPELLEKMHALVAATSADELKRALKAFYDADALLRREPPVATLPIELAITELVVS